MCRAQSTPVPPIGSKLETGEQCLQLLGCWNDVGLHLKGRNSDYVQMKMTSIHFTGSFYKNGNIINQ